MEKTIWLDMDGTFVNLYGVKNWLPMLEAEDPTPYAVAKPLVNMSTLARLLNKAQKNGWKLGVISWLSKNGSETYDKEVMTAKRKWLTHHLKSVRFDYVDIVTYGTPKQNGRTGVLFDDEEPNRRNWNGTAYKAEELIETLKAIA